MSRFFKKVLPLALLAVISITGLVSCQSKDDTQNGEATKKETGATDSEKKTITLGAYAGPYDDLFRDAIKPILEKKGYTIKEVEFSEPKLFDVALTEGSVDFNVSQHTAYMNNFNKNEGSKITAITKIPTVQTAIFSEKHKSMDEIQKGAKVALPQDPSNAARAFALLQKAGWVKIKSGVELMQATVEDIEENKHEIEFVEMDSAQIPRSLPDVDYAVIPGSIVYNAKMDPQKSLLAEDILDDLMIVLAVDEKNKDTAWAKDIKDAYNSDEFKKYMEENNKNNYWFVPTN